MAIASVTAGTTINPTTFGNAVVDQLNRITDGAWVAWTPTVTQTGTVTCTVNRAVYHRAGRKITLKVQMTVTGSGTGSSAVVISNLPATASTSGDIVGNGSIFDASASAYKSGIAFLESSTTITIRSTLDAAPSDNRFGVYSFTSGLAVSDVIRIEGTYEAAS